jgi:citrate synthase
MEKQSKRPEKHGVFYPRGYAIVAFKTQADAERVRQLLVDGGYAEDDVQLLDTERVLQGSSEDLQNLSPLMKMLGSEPHVMEGHRAAAGAGRTFLLAYAPSELDTERLMNVARRVGYVSAQKYDRFTLTDL